MSGTREQFKLLVRRFWNDVVGHFNIASVSTWNAAVPFDISGTLFQSLISFVIGRIGFMVKVDYVQFCRKLVSFAFVRRSRFKIKNIEVTVVRYWTVLFYFYSFVMEWKLCELVCPLQNCDTTFMRLSSLVHLTFIPELFRSNPGCHMTYRYWGFRRLPQSL
jgi:hypothetical protein